MIKSTRLRWAGHITRVEAGRSAFKMLTGTPRGKRVLGSPRSRWEDNIRMNIKEIALNTRNWVGLTQNKEYWRYLVKAVLNLRVA